MYLLDIIDVDPHQVGQRVIDRVDRISGAEIDGVILDVVQPRRQGHVAVVGDGVILGAVVGLANFLPEAGGVLRFPACLAGVRLEHAPELAILAHLIDDRVRRTRRPGPCGSRA